MKKVKRLLKLSILAVFMVSVGMMVFTSCEEDDPKVDAMVGNYAFTSAVLASDLMNADTVFMPSGTNVTLIVGGGMFGSTPCDNVLNAAVELRKSNEIYFVCCGETNELKAGIWSIDDERTTLTLTLSPPAVPQALALEVTELVEGATTFTGKITNLPVSSEIFQLPPGGVLLLTINITFTKLPVC